jgi:Na+-transporting NADH:ubiquinone oxidoreductase subunit C
MFFLFKNYKKSNTVHSNRYTFIYAIILSAITAVALAFSAEGLKPFQDANIALDTKTNILKSVREYSTDRATIEKIYAERIKEIVLDGQANELTDVKAASINLKDEITKPAENRQLPLYIYTHTDNKKYYVIPMRGVGLWGPIWGYISISDDFDTVFGATFDHKSETPGLGAEIAEKPFQQQFEGKKIMSGDNFISVNVVKPSASSDVSTEHRVDGVSGGTITSTGTDKMLKNCIAPYLKYFKKIKMGIQ